MGRIAIRGQRCCCGEESTAPGSHRAGTPASVRITPGAPEATERQKAVSFSLIKPALQIPTQMQNQLYLIKSSAKGRRGCGAGTAK